MSLASKHPIENLTHEALLASEAGHWDHVAILYQKRGVEFVFEELPSVVVDRLIRIDRMIQARAKIVHAAAKLDLEESQLKRRKFQQWKQQLTSSPQAGSRFVSSA
ncbi:MAG: hypothetical protein ACPGYT_00655 [Nitrospirales bacterium]